MALWLRVLVALAENLGIENGPGSVPTSTYQLTIIH